MKSTGSWYLVEAADGDGETFRCRIRGRLRLKGIRTTNPVAVGDWVVFDTEETEEGAVGTITAVEPRKNYVIRRATNLSREAHIIAANVDQAFLVVTLDFPPTSPEFIDRFLVTCEMYRVPVTILLNKIDLFGDPAFAGAVADFHAVYEGAGYRVLEVSALYGQSMDRLEEMMKGRVSLFSGHSGVGKSTLIGTLIPEFEIRTGDISDYHRKGKHTTTFSEMFPLPGGGYLIDTPGIKGFGIVDADAKELARYFPDLFREAAECRFYNCTHTHEPYCAVKAAVEAGRIAPERYVSYLKMMEDDDKYRK